MAYTLVQVETAIMKSLRVDQIPCNLWMDMEPVGRFGSSNRSGREKYQGANTHLLMCKFPWTLSRGNRKGICSGWNEWMNY